MTLVYSLLILIVTVSVSAIDYRTYKNKFRVTLLVISGLLLIGWLAEPEWWPTGSDRYAILTEGYVPNEVSISAYDTVYSLVDEDRNNPIRQWLSSISMITDRIPKGSTIDLFGHGIQQQLPDGYEWRDRLSDPPRGLVLREAPFQVEVGKPFNIELFLEGGGDQDSIQVFKEGEFLTTLTSGTNGTVKFEEVLYLEGPASYAFEWIRDGELYRETLSVRAVKPRLLTIGALLYSPSFEINYLTQHFGERGHSVIGRSRIGQERFRYDAINSETSDAKAFFNHLKEMDILILDSREYLMLRPAQKTQIMSAITQGLDILLRPPAVENAGEWTAVFSSLSNSDVSVQALNRLRERNWVPDLAQTEETSTPLPLLDLNFEVIPEGSQRQLNYSENEPISIRIPNGSGSVTGYLFYKTYSWLIEGRVGLYNMFWTEFLSNALILEEAGMDLRPMLPRIHQRMDFIVTQPGSLQKAKVGSVFETRTEELAVWQSPGVPDVHVIKYWPRNTAWHHIEYAGEKAWVYVYGDESWSTHEATRRLKYTKNETLRVSDRRGDLTGNTRKVPDSIWLLGFLTFQIVLWAERKLI